MGYYELCNDNSHFLGLLAKNKRDEEIFDKRYRELKEWERRMDYYNKEITFNDILENLEF